MNSTTKEQREKWIKKIEVIYKAMNLGCLNLTDWELDFYDNIYNKVIENKEDISFKQSCCLNKIFNKIQ